MLQIPRKTFIMLITAIAVVAVIGATAGAFMAFVPAPPEDTGATEATQSTQIEPAPAPQPAPDPRSATLEGVSLTLVEIRKSADPKGIEVSIDLSNQSSKAVAFAFNPERTMTLADNAGSNYNFRWAEYKGELTVEPGQKMRLVTAFFAGPDKDTNPDRLMVGLSGVPQFGKATWEITWPDGSNKPTQITASTPAPAAAPEKPANGVGTMVTQNKISVTLGMADVDLEQGGLTIVLMILNNTSGEIAFPFTPDRSITVVDNRGSKFNLKWAEYAGATTVAKGQQVRLVKAFFEGPVKDPSTNQLTISLSDVPEFGKATWQVPITR